MKKRISLLLLTALLAACSSKTPVNLVHTQQPILNIEASLDPLIDAGVGSDSAWIKNKTAQLVGVAYDLFWYDKNGVTQMFDEDKSRLSSTVLLEPQQKIAIDLAKPTAESANYRLYLRLK